MTENQKRIDLQAIAENLLSDNAQITNYFKTNENSLIITGNKLLTKYPQLKKLSDNALIKYIKNENGISPIIPFFATHDDKVTLFDTNNEIIENWEIISYKFTDTIATVIITIDKSEIVVSARLSKEAKKLIANSDNLSIEGKNLKIDLLKENIPFIPIRELPKSDYSLVQNHNKRTEKYKDLLIDLEDTNSGEIYRYVAVNKEVEKLISKYDKKTKFSIVDHQKFTNKEDKEAIKTVIKDLNFEDDLSDLNLF